MDSNDSRLAAMWMKKAIYDHSLTQSAHDHPVSSLEGIQSELQGNAVAKKPS